MACEGIESRKQSWPELVGVDGMEAEATIERENPVVNAKIIKVGSTDPEVIHDIFRCDRVWVWVDEQGLVAKTPQIG
ncbi:hypothetical protein Taro_047631 [Colocasia esculenta]|uniref:Uncharacterized protein n=1 Tax=Colocasia esculenta TaxID=4460 RepID=A0A843X5M6_COLES|nr:hypothetical protein [Colocasia esculenta]